MKAYNGKNCPKCNSEMLKGKEVLEGNFLESIHKCPQCNEEVTVMFMCEGSGVEDISKEV